MGNTIAKTNPPVKPPPKSIVCLVKDALLQRYLDRGWRIMMLTRRISSREPSIHSSKKEEEEEEEPRLLPTFHDPFFAAPLVHFVFQHRAHASMTCPETYIDFVECLVSDMLVQRCRRAGTLLFLTQARAALRQPAHANLRDACPVTWRQSDNHACLLALNACRYLWEEALPAAVEGAPDPTNDPENLPLLRFYEHRDAFAWMTREQSEREELETRMGDDDDVPALLMSFCARRVRVLDAATTERPARLVAPRAGS